MMTTKTELDVSVEQDDVILTLRVRWPAASFLAIARQVHDILHPVRAIRPERPIIEHHNDD